MNKKNLKNMCFAGIMTALVFVITAYLHIPTVNGYIHVGDGFIYLAASLLPWQYAVAVGAGGALLADCLTGFAIWAPASVIIKALTALTFTSSGDKILKLRNYLALIISAVLCAGGYYLYEALIYNSFVSPLVGIPASLTQSVFSSLLYLGIGLAIDKTDYKHKLMG